MKISKNPRGKSEMILFQPHVGKRCHEPKKTHLVRTSVRDSYGRPTLIFGQNHYLNGKQVADLIEHLQSWLDTGSLKKPKQLKTSDFGGALGGGEMIRGERIVWTDPLTAKLDAAARRKSKVSKTSKRGR